MAVETGEPGVPGPAPDPALTLEAIPGLARPGSRSVGPGRGSTAERLLRLAGPLLVAACCAFVLWQLRPDLLVRDTTPNGGDLGAHVWFPAYLRDHLLPRWRVAGWSPDWYAGFPAGQFYFPLPALLVVALDMVLPYNVAFKVVTVLGPVGLPAAAFACARGLRLRPPAPALCAPAAVAFLFFKGNPGASDAARNIAFNQGIMGGTLRSTLAGEFSFVIALALALCFVGALAVALRDARRPWLPAVLLAVVVLSHVVVGIFAAVAGVVVWLFYRPRRTFLVAAAIGVVGALLTAFWTLPLVATFGYTSNMRYQKITEYVTYLFPTYFWWLFALAVLAVVTGFVRRDRGVLALFAVAVVFAIVFRLWPEAHAWNLRFLPFWYLGVFLLAGAGAGELAALAGRVADWTMHAPDPGPDRERSVDEPILTGSTRAGSTDAGSTGTARRRIVRSATVAVVALGLTVATLARVDQTRGFLAFWADWNYSGYEDTAGAATASHRPKAWTEFRSLIGEMRALPPGRALWEGGSSIDAYGSPLALMMLPYFTGGHTASMEGLYFESSASTPYHFMMAAALEGPGNASNPVRGLRYRTIQDFDLGVRYLQLFGVRYYLAYSKEARQRAEANPDLRRVAAVSDRDGKAPEGWGIYEVRDSPLVAPLRYEPVVATGVRAGSQSECFGTTPTVPDPQLSPWECLAASWFDDPRALDRPLAADGPGSWKRVTAGRAKDAARTPLPPVRVTRVRSDEDSVRFEVSRPGVPVVVKVSDFPNWAASGAKGPYRITPNLMVVVPTSRRVELRYERTTVERVGIVASLLGLAGLAALVHFGRPRRRRAERRGTEDLEPDRGGPALR